MVKYSKVKEEMDTFFKNYGGDEFDVNYVNLCGTDPKTGLNISFSASYRKPYKPIDDENVEE